MFSLVSIFILSQLQAFAGTIDCRKEALDYGSKKANLEPSCLIEVMKNPSATVVSKDSNMQISAKNGIIVVRENSPFKDSVISGSKSNLANVTALALDEKNNEVFAFDSDLKAILVFDTKVTGNLSPKRVIRHAKINPGVKLSFDDQANELKIDDGKNVMRVSRNANSNSKRPADAVNLK